jgi:hypothetical protein
MVKRFSGDAIPFIDLEAILPGSLKALQKFAGRSVNEFLFR